MNYRFTWLVFWLWKVSSADAVIQFTLLAILFDKLWVSNSWPHHYQDHLFFSIGSTERCYIRAVVPLCPFFLTPSLLHFPISASLPRSHSEGRHHAMTTLYSPSPSLHTHTLLRMLQCRLLRSSVYTILLFYHLELMVIQCLFSDMGSDLDFFRIYSVVDCCAYITTSPNWGLY